ncbi:nucleoid-associated protein, partial [Pseudoxanthomonas sp. SGD-10]
FSEEVIGNEVAATSFKEMIQQYEEEFDTQIGDSFEISPQAVKKQNSNYKSVLKLDKNFSVYVHGDRKLIENDYDEEKGMNYYKLYYKEER